MTNPTVSSESEQLKLAAHEILTQFCGVIHSSEFASRVRITVKQFTRNRILTISVLVGLILNRMHRGLQSAVFDFCNNVFGDADSLSMVTSSALCQARGKLCPESLKYLLESTYALFRKHVEAPRWNGYNIYAVDGTTLRLPQKDICINTFGGQASKTGDETHAMARAVALYDVARECVANVQLGKYSTGERELAVPLLEGIGNKDLLLFDRGFPGRELIALHQQRNISFCMRITYSTWKELRNLVELGEIDKVCNLGNMEKPLKTSGLSRQIYQTEQNTILLPPLWIQVLRQACLQICILDVGELKSVSNKSKLTCNWKIGLVIWNTPFIRTFMQP